jgi:hypothetical protein
MADDSGTGVQFGKAAKIDPSKSVFITCPYDDAFAQLFYAIIFATACCGFVPRSAIEAGGTGGIPRIARITDALFSSNYSIHDLSKCKGEGDDNLARFNMPLELGMALSLAVLRGKSKERKHEWLALVPDGSQYHKYISDLGAYDPAKYDGTVNTIVQRIMAWLQTAPGALTAHTPPDVLAALPKFQAEAEALKQQWGEVIWWRVVSASVKHVPPVNAPAAP